MRHILVSLLAIACFCSTVHAQQMTLEQINAYPDTAVLYTPVILVVKLTNIGAVPIAVPEKAGLSFLASAPDEHINQNTPGRNAGLLSGIAFTTLQPGESLYDSVSVGSMLQKPGTYEFGWRLSYDGPCKADVQCFNGTIQSAPISIHAVEPSPQEKEVLDFATASHPFKTTETPGAGFLLAMTFDDLQKHYPTSFYTYAAAIYRATFPYSGDYRAAVNWAVKNMPGNPLENTARLALAQRETGAGRPIDLKTIQSDALRSYLQWSARARPAK